MTVSEAIIKWLKQFEVNDEQQIKSMDTDIQSPEEYTYSLVREPIRNIKTYISGKKTYTDHYTVQARLPSQYNMTRTENREFGEALEEWVSAQNSAGAFPDIPDAAVQSIGITTPFYVGQTQENSSIYQMTIAIKYEKEI